MIARADPDSVKPASAQAIDDIIAQAIAEGRYEPDDPREVNPHASTRPHKRHKPIGPLIYDIFDDGKRGKR